MEYWLQGEVDKVFVHSSVFKNREAVPCLHTCRNDPVERARWSCKRKKRHRNGLDRRKEMEPSIQIRVNSLGFEKELTHPYRREDYVQKMVLELICSGKQGICSSSCINFLTEINRISSTKGARSRSLRREQKGKYRKPSWNRLLDCWAEIWTFQNYGHQF